MASCFISGMSSRFIRLTPAGCENLCEATNGLNRRFLASGVAYVLLWGETTLPQILPGCAACSMHVCGETSHVFDVRRYLFAQMIFLPGGQQPMDMHDHFIRGHVG